MDGVFALYKVAYLDMDRSRDGLENGAAQQAFEQDLAECRRYGVNGFPTLLFRVGGQCVIAPGHRTFATTCTRWSKYWARPNGPNYHHATS